MRYRGFRRKMARIRRRVRRIRSIRYHSRGGGRA